MKHCHNYHDFRILAKKRLPSPIFNYIDGAADDEITYKRNTSAFNDVDLIPRVLAGVENVDLSTTIFGKKLDMPLYCAPTALQRLFHHEGERAVARAAEKFGTMFGVSSLGTVSVEEIASIEGVDCLWVGHFDLTNFLGIPGNFKSSIYLDAINRIVYAAKSANKSIGIMINNKDELEMYSNLGFNLIAVGTEMSLLGREVSNILE